MSDTRTAPVKISEAAAPMSSGPASRPSMAPALVRDRMTTPVVRVQSMARVTRVARLMEARQISSVPVMEKGRLVGIVSTTDVLRSRVVEPMSDSEIDEAKRRITRGANASATPAPTTSTPKGSGPAGSDGPPEPPAAVWRVKDIMTSPVVITHPNERVDEAAWRMVAARVHRLVVVDHLAPREGEQREDDAQLVVGILSARDVLEELMSRRLDNPLRDIMSTPVETIELGDSVEQALERLVASNLHGLVVVDGLAPIGVFTHQEALSARRLPPTLRSSPVEQVMSYETICVDASTPIWRAAAYAVQTNVRRLLVCENKHLVGITSVIDLAGALARSPV